MVNKMSLQESILKAVNTIVEQRTNELKVDKTITAIIEKNMGVFGGKTLYKLMYKGGFFEAVVLNAEETYLPNTSVYVLIPQGDFSKEKVIIGRTNNINLEKDFSSSVSNVPNQYCLVGGNLLYNAKKDDPEMVSNLQYGVHSYHDHLEEDENPDSILHRYNQICYYNTDNQYEEFYNRKDLEDENILMPIYNQNLAFNIEGLNILKEQATSLMVQADFKTNLTTEQRQQAEGEYGLILNLTFKSLNKDYGSTNGEIFNKVADTIVGKIYISGGQASNFNCSPIDDDLNTYNYYDVKLIDIHNYYINQIKKSNKNIRNNIRLLIEYTNNLKTTFSTNENTKKLYTDIIENAIESYLSFLNELELVNNIENFNTLYNDWWTEKVGSVEDKIISYKISSNNMLGNPLSFNQWNTQYQILDIDIKNLIRIDSIILYQQGFLENAENELSWPINNPGPDILIKNLQIYPVKPLESKNEDYTLKVQPRVLENDINANILTGTTSTDIVAFEAIFMRKMTEDLTKNTRVSYFWFKEDSAVVDVNSTGYNSLAGIGWKRISLIKGNSFIVSGSNNLAYKNNYKCVVQYIENERNTVILDTVFTIYNKSINTDVLLESNIGTTFSFFENIKPKIICRINEDLNSSDILENYQEISFNEEKYPKYRYYWVITDSTNGNKIFLNDIDNNKEQSDNTDQFNNILKSIDIENIEYYKINSDLEEIPTEKSIEATRIVYPINELSSSFTVDCFVKRKTSIVGSNNIRYVDAGSATLEFLNKGLDIDLNSFKITIENGNQVFQYDEYGNAPTSIKNKEPLEILSLRAKVFAPSGIEIKNSNYFVEWIFPIDNSMISATGPLEREENNFIYRGTVCDFDIIELYNPDYYNNQITCHVIYNNQSLYKDTNFLFTKMGENSTNGTDVTAKINYTGEDALNTLHNQPLTIYAQETDNKLKAMFNVPDGNGKRRILSDILQLVGTKGILDVDLYQKGAKISSDNYAATYPRWNLLGNNSYSRNHGKYFNIVKDEDFYNINWDGSNNSPEKELYQIIKTEVQLNTGQTYYATYNIPIIWYSENSESILDINNLIAIDRSYYLSSILYNADGRNPTYNHNQGLKFINIPENITKILWEVKGGCIDLLLEDNTTTKVYEQEENIKADEKISILPSDIYDGGITNNHIQVSFYAENNLIAIAYVPIYMSLNTFGLASLNAWDGNHVEVNEDEGYIMAPQIGAGEKDSNSRFTGILMGKTEGEVGYTGQTDSQIGLFGYAKGVQSIFLDAQTGEATFGLPNGLHLDENGILEKGNNFNEGRIELRPGGESIIGGWTLGNRSIYYTSKRQIDENNNEKWVYSGQLEKRTLHDYIPNWQTGLVEKDLKDSYFKYHEKDIKYNESGILLYAGESPYISIKGRPFTEEDIPKNITSEKESIIAPNDSLELQLDTATPTLFTIFRHNGGNREGIEGATGDNDNYELGSRTFLAGINSQGEFIANSLRSANTIDIIVPTGVDTEKTWKAGSLVTKFAINTLNAFDDFTYEPIPKTSHIGFEITANDEDTLAHFFTKINGLKVRGNNEVNENYNPTLHISGGYTDENGEYSRPLALHGKDIQMYALDSSGGSSTTDNDKFLSETDAGLKISTNEAKLQLGSTKFNLFRDNENETNTLSTVNSLSINVGKEILGETRVEEYDAGNGNWKSLDDQPDYLKYKQFSTDMCYVQDSSELNKVRKPSSDKYVNLVQINKYINKINNNTLMRYYIDSNTENNLNNFVLLRNSDYYYRTQNENTDNDYVLVDSYSNNTYYKNINDEIRSIQEIYRFDDNTQNYYFLNSKEEIDTTSNNSLDQYFVSIEKSEEEKLNEQYQYITNNEFNNNIFYMQNDNYINIESFKDIYCRRRNLNNEIIYVNKKRIDENARPFIIIEHEKNIFGFVENVQHYWLDEFDDYNLYFKININGESYYVTHFILNTYLKIGEEEQMIDSKEFDTTLPDHSYWYQKYYEQTINSSIIYRIIPSFIDNKPEGDQTEFEMTSVNMVDFNKDVNFDNTSILNIYKKYIGEITEGMYQYFLKNEVDTAQPYYYYKDSLDFYSNLTSNENNKIYYKLKDSNNFVEITSSDQLYYYSETFNSYISFDLIDIENNYSFENNRYEVINIENISNLDNNLSYKKIITPRVVSDYKWVTLNQWLGGEILKEYCLTENKKYIPKNDFSTERMYLKINDNYIQVDNNADNFNYIYIEDNKSSEPFFISISKFKEIAENESNCYLIINSNNYYIGNEGWQERDGDYVYNSNSNIRQRFISNPGSNQIYSLRSGIYKNAIQKDINTYTKVDIDKNIDIDNSRPINMVSSKDLDIKLINKGQFSLMEDLAQLTRIEINGNIKKQYGLIIDQDSTSLLGEDLNITSEKQIKITSPNVGSGTTYNFQTPQILLIAGENEINVEVEGKQEKRDYSTKLILNSSDNGWKNRDSSILSYPTFEVKSRLGHIGIFPWYEVDDLYSEQFQVGMSQVITGGLQIQGRYGNNDTAVGLQVINDIKARKFIGQDWNSLFKLRGSYNITTVDEWENGKQKKVTTEKIVGKNDSGLRSLSVGGFTTFSIPKITIVEKGQPFIENNSVSIAIPSAEAIFNAIKDFFGTAAFKNTSDFAAANHNHDSRYAKISDLNNYVTSVNGRTSGASIIISYEKGNRSFSKNIGSVTVPKTN